LRCGTGLQPLFAGEIALDQLRSILSIRCAWSEYRDVSPVPLPDGRGSDLRYGSEMRCGTGLQPVFAAATKCDRHHLFLQCVSLLVTTPS